MADESRWYVVHTYSGYENKVASNLETTVQNRQLQDLIQEVRVPTETVTEVKDNKRRDVERKIFPGYVLVKMVLTDESWYVVRNIRGCTGFVGPSSKPTAGRFCGNSRRNESGKEHGSRDGLHVWTRNPRGTGTRPGRSGGLSF